MMSAGWYLRRLSRMGPAEIAARTATAARIRRWRRPLPDPFELGTVLTDRRFVTGLPSDLWDRACPEATRRLLETAESLLDGDAEYFGVQRYDMAEPDWSFDPKTGNRAPTDSYAFDVPYRDERVVGDIKQLWEPSRHQHLTVLAAAYARTGDDRYAQRVADHLKSWWAENPPLRGVHWVSGIELGIRLLSWVWVRRLLDGWSGVAGLFEKNPDALNQIWHHGRWLAAMRSRGSSANNHVIAEDSGLLATACAFPWFRESAYWRAQAMSSLDRQLCANTFDSGLNREQASDYHGLVLELGLAAAAEATAAGSIVPETTWTVLLRMTDALAAVVDTRLRPPRQGDSDDGFGLVVDGKGTDRWQSLLATGGVLFGRCDWWPEVATGDIRTIALTSLVRPPRRSAQDRPQRRPSHFADAGMTILRTTGAPEDEIWCRPDAGPHGFRSIAAHAHADALSVEVRHGGVDILADPGTFCYHGDPEWRTYFRSTLGHNTLELDGKDQSTSGGPFMWTRHARSRLLETDENSWWLAEHKGYSRRGRPAVHRRAVELDAASRVLRIHDEITVLDRRPCRLAFHLGPAVTADVFGAGAVLRWTAGGQVRRAWLALPEELDWSVHEGETDPVLGWYSESFGRKQPTVTLLGTGSVDRDTVLHTALRFGDRRKVSR